jgi:HD-GYP domain-containing protein (c-di-GMP phosphodiesterase class II)
LVRLDRDNPLIAWFSTKEPRLKIQKDFLRYSDLVGWIREKEADAGETVLAARLFKLKQAMDILKAMVCVPGFYKGELLGVMILGEKSSREPFTDEEVSFFQTLAMDASLTIKAAKFREELLARSLELELKQKELSEKLHEIEHLRSREQATYTEIVHSLAREVYEKDPYTSGHMSSVERLGLITAKELGYDVDDPKKREALKASLHLHDVGKIGIPDEILKKAGPLTDAEWKIMRTHPVKAAKILEPLSGFRQVAKIVMHHHENFDGTGYPDGLKGEAIPIEARIISVVDAFHAIISTRCYRKGRSVEVAYQELEKGSGTQFDPRVVQALIRALSKQRAGTESVEELSEPRHVEA